MEYANFKCRAQCHTENEDVLKVSSHNHVQDAAKSKSEKDGESQNTWKISAGIFTSDHWSIHIWTTSTSTMYQTNCQKNSSTDWKAVTKSVEFAGSRNPRQLQEDNERRRSSDV